MLDRKPGKDVWVVEADSGTFLGDIATFTGEPAIAECVADEPTDVIVFERDARQAVDDARARAAALLARSLTCDGAVRDHGPWPRRGRRCWDLLSLLEQLGPRALAVGGARGSGRLRARLGL